MESEVNSRCLDQELTYENELHALRNLGNRAEHLSKSKLKVKEYWKKWAAERRSETSEGWKITQDQMARDFILPLIGNRMISDLEPNHIGAILSRMEDLGKGSQTRRHVYNMLHKMFDDASDYCRLIEKNPVSSRDRPTVRTTPSKSITPENAVKLLKKSRNHYIGPAIWIALLAGLRASEIQALRWKNIDFDRRVIRIVEAFKRKVGKVEPYPKQKRHGDAPISNLLMDYLKEIKGASKDCDLVIPGLKGEILNHGTFLRSVKKLCIEINIPPVAPHALRHGCTEIWIRNGANEEDIIRLLNHSGAGAVRKYIHRTNDRLEEIGYSINENTLGMHRNYNP